MIRNLRRPSLRKNKKLVPPNHPHLHHAPHFRHRTNASRTRHYFRTFPFAIKRNAGRRRALPQTPSPLPARLCESSRSSGLPTTRGPCQPAAAAPRRRPSKAGRHRRSSFPISGVRNLSLHDPPETTIPSASCIAAAGNACQRKCHCNRQKALGARHAIPPTFRNVGNRDCGALPDCLDKN